MNWFESLGVCCVHFASAFYVCVCVRKRVCVCVGGGRGGG